MGEQFYCPDCGHVEDAPGDCYQCDQPLKKQGVDGQPLDRLEEHELDLEPAEAGANSGVLDDFDDEETEAGFEGGMRVA